MSPLLSASGNKNASGGRELEKGPFPGTLGLYLCGSNAQRHLPPAGRSFTHSVPVPGAGATASPAGKGPPLQGRYHGRLSHVAHPGWVPSHPPPRDLFQHLSGCAAPLSRLVIPSPPRKDSLGGRRSAGLWEVPSRWLPTPLSTQHKGRSLANFPGYPPRPRGDPSAGRSLERTRLP